MQFQSINRPAALAIASTEPIRRALVADDVSEARRLADDLLLRAPAVVVGPEIEIPPAAHEALRWRLERVNDLRAHGRVSACTNR